MGVNTARIALNQPIGTLAATANAAGTTTTIKVPTAGDTLTINAVFRLFTGAGPTLTIKERTNFTVVSIVSAAGTDTVTFSPAAAQATASGDQTWIPEVVDVQTAIANQMGTLDSILQATVVTSTTRPASPFNGQLIYETDTNIFWVYYAGWNELSGTHRATGRVGYNTLNTQSQAIFQNQEQTNPWTKITFNAQYNKRYLIRWGCGLIQNNGTDAQCYLRIHYKLGTSVGNTAALVGQQNCDHADAGTNYTTNNSGFMIFIPITPGQYTVGAFLARPATGDGKDCLTDVGHNYLAIEDIGA